MLKLAELNAMDQERFTGALSGIFEHSPWIVAEAVKRRPFQSTDDLYSALCETVVKASADKRLSLIRAHPDLVGNATLTAESRGEQEAAGLGKLSPDEIARFREYNTRYRERFGFPFVICARLNKKDAILETFPIRLQNSREHEIETALREIFKIAELRLNDLIE
jgi:2-oxo-4-hydroxy-4-carboxy-5-ureidoimidazoline decarboxylase